MAVPSPNADKTAASAQSMDQSPSARPTSTAASDSPLSSNADPSETNSNYSPSPSRQLDSQSSMKSEEYRQLFRLPPEEVLTQDFNCALQENFILQGHMYLFDHYICFYSNLFGFETKKIIHFQEVTSVKRAKTAAIFPTAIEVVAAGKKYFFTSFLSRDEAFKLIDDGWLEHGNGAKASLDQQESRSELNGQEPGNVIVEKSNGTKQLMNESEVTTRNNTDSASEDFEEVLVTSSGVQDIVEEDAVLVLDTDCSPSGKSLSWEVEDTDAPDVPECYTLVAASKFPIKVEEFFNIFFSDDALSFLESFHEKCENKDLRCTSWKPYEQFVHARDVSFQHPIKMYLANRFGSCKEVQKYRVYRNSHLVIKTSQEVSDVPYGDYFRVEGLWDVETDGDESNGGCSLRVYVHVAFSKKTMWKGKIVHATNEEYRDTFGTWIQLAHDLLVQKNIEKEAGEPLANSIPDGVVHKEAEEKTVEHSERTHVELESDLRMSETSPESTDSNQISAPLQGGLRHAGAVASFSRNSMVKLISSLKSESQVPSFVVIILAVIILLMQISIVVLLLRPQPVQMIPESSWISNISTERRGERVALVNKQINHLTEEMVMVETLLAKLQHEHEVLKVQLKNLLAVDT